MNDQLDRQAVRDEMDRARQEIHRLLDQATPAGLGGPTQGTRWTNEQLLFHMLFGYLITRALILPARAFGRLHGGASRAFAGLLDAARVPFHLVNYAGSCAGARLIPASRMGGTMDRVIAGLQRRLDREPDAALRRGMHYPTTWDPFFTGCMTHRYPTRHFDYHRRQLTLPDTGQPGTGGYPPVFGVARPSTPS